MAAIDIDGGVPATTLSSGITSGDTSIPLADGTGYPDGGSGNFYIVIDKGLSTQEVIECSARAGTTVTAATRGADGSTATAHASGAAVEHVVPASELQALSTHAAATTGTPHGSAYLTTTTHAAIAHDDSMLAAGSVTNTQVAAGIDAAKLTGTASVDTTGNAATATTATTAAAWTTARDLSFTGDVTGTGSVDGSANVATALTIGAGAVENAMIGLTFDSFTPSIAQGGSAIALSSSTAQYVEFGGIGIAFGSATFSGAGTASNQILMTVPGTGLAGSANFVGGSFWMRESGGTPSYAGIVTGESIADDTIKFIVGGDDGSQGINGEELGSGMTIASGDVLRFFVLWRVG